MSFEFFHDVISIEALYYIITSVCIVVTGFCCVGTLSVYFVESNLVQTLYPLYNFAEGVYLFRIAGDLQEDPLYFEQHLTWCIVLLLMLGVLTQTLLYVFCMVGSFGLLTIASDFRFNTLASMFHKDELINLTAES